MQTARGEPKLQLRLSVPLLLSHSGRTLAALIPAPAADPLRICLMGTPHEAQWYNSALRIVTEL